MTSRQEKLLVRGSGWVELKSHVTPGAGWLVVATAGVDRLPAAFIRAYWIGGSPPAARRGGHCHRLTKQVLFCLAGRCRLKLDDGRREQVVKVDDPAIGLLLEPGLWHEMFDFSPDCRLLVLADRPYDESDYVRDYNDFKRLRLTYD